MFLSKQKYLYSIDWLWFSKHTVLAQSKMLLHDQRFLFTFAFFKHLCDILIENALLFAVFKLNHHWIQLIIIITPSICVENTIELFYLDLTLKRTNLVLAVTISVACTIKVLQ
jgi:hypothetical protein